jgi:F0F1-type ATP synthase epsilon subunit
MKVRVYSPFQIYFEGLAISTSAVNDTGPFDILPNHKNFICLLKPSPINIRLPNGGKDVQIPVTRGMMHVKADQVTVFLDI